MTFRTVTQAPAVDEADKVGEKRAAELHPTHEGEPQAPYVSLCPQAAGQAFSVEASGTHPCHSALEGLELCPGLRRALLLVGVVLGPRLPVSQGLAQCSRV